MAFPNPYTDFIHLTNAIHLPLSYRLYHIIGRNVLNGSILDNPSISIDLLPPGMYIMVVDGKAISMIKH